MNPSQTSEWFETLVAELEDRLRPRGYEKKKTPKPAAIVRRRERLCRIRERDGSRQIHLGREGEGVYPSGVPQENLRHEHVPARLERQA